jgi:hypothetical protein
MSNLRNRTVLLAFLAALALGGALWALSAQVLGPRGESFWIYDLRGDAGLGERSGVAASDEGIVLSHFRPAPAAGNGWHDLRLVSGYGQNLYGLGLGGDIVVYNPERDSQSRCPCLSPTRGVSRRDPRPTRDCTAPSRCRIGPGAVHLRPRHKTHGGARPGIYSAEQSLH